jgi:hypothetical protein
MRDMSIADSLQCGQVLVVERIQDDQTQNCGELSDVQYAALVV